MTRTMTIAIATAFTLGLVTVLPAGAMASTSGYASLDADVSRAFANGRLTRAERDEVRSLMARADKIIDTAQRDGVISPGESRRIDKATSAATSAFDRFRGNGATAVTVRTVTPRPVPAVVFRPAPKPKVRVVVKPHKGRIRIR